MNACVVIGPGGALAVTNVGVAVFLVVNGAWVKNAFSGALAVDTTRVKNMHIHTTNIANHRLCVTGSTCKNKVKR